MKSLEVQIEEPTVDRLEAAAQKLARLDESFRSAVDQVVSKNAELYKRLA